MAVYSNGQAAFCSFLVQILLYDTNLKREHIEKENTNLKREHI